VISELLIHIMGCDAVWYANPGTLKNMIKWDGRWHVGFWTGPQLDLVCIKKCKTNEEADRYLSPGGRTILSATLKTLSARIRAGEKIDFQKLFKTKIDLSKHRDLC